MVGKEYPAMKHTAYSYIRFSTREQGKGDSKRRQTEAAADWCARNGATLDTSTTFHDLGRSAFTGSHRSNPDRNALAAFLKMVEQGKIARGSYLLVESLDRLTREHIRPALTLLLNLIEAGVSVVQLRPVEIIYDTNVEPMTLMMALMELSRGNSESAVKSARVGAAWAKKKDLARQGAAQAGRGPVAGMACMTHRLPGWIEEVGGKMRLIPGRGAIVKRIYKLAANGYSATAILKRFKAEGVPPMGRSGKWCRSYICHILSDRRPVGEYQGKNRKQQPEGEPIPNYFPPCVTDAEWRAARAVLAGRRLPPARTTDFVNLFSGLLRDARDGTSYHRQVAGGKRAYDTLANKCQDSGLPKRSFPLATLEASILSKLKEIDPASILGDHHEPDEMAGLVAELCGVDARIAEFEAELLNGNVSALARQLRTLEEQKRTVASKLDELRKKQMHPLDASWSQAKSLLGAMHKAKDPMDARLRLRSALRRIVESMSMLIVLRGINRVAVVQIHFAGGKHRDFLILHRSGKGNGAYRSDGSTTMSSLDWAAGSKELAADFDLRVPAYVQRLTARLEQMPLEELAEYCHDTVEVVESREAA
jgi:DNA invertase Pin-like site-specific DNA recombinase